MAIANYEVQALFAEPIFRADVSHAISAEQVEFIKNVQMVKNQVNLISENLYLFKEPEMQSIADAVHFGLLEQVEVLRNQVHLVLHHLHVQGARNAEHRGCCAGSARHLRA